MELVTGLSLISSYSDDEDDVNDLETSDSNFNTSKPEKLQSVSNQTRLPLPSSIVKLFSGSNEVSRVPPDDPTLHEGRIRSFPHQRGNWSTYVYIPYEPEVGFEWLLSQMTSCVAQAGVQLQPVAEPHISLTRTVVLLHHWIDNFVTSIKTKLVHHPRFPIELCGLAVYCNEEKSRTFLGLRVATGSPQLKEVTRALDQCLAEFRLPPFYEEASFHMSVLWALGDHKSTLEGVLPQLTTVFSAYSAEHPQELHIDVSQCLCKAGNKLFVFPMAAL